jgi:hypothetical protein
MKKTVIVFVLLFLCSIAQATIVPLHDPYAVHVDGLDTLEGNWNLGGFNLAGGGSITGTSFTLDSTNDYLLTQRGIGQAFAIQNQTSNIASRWELFAKDGDGADTLAFRIFAKGTPADISTAAEVIELAYDTVVEGGPRFAIRSYASGTGSTLPISLYTGANTTQFILNTDNSIGMSGTLTCPILTLLEQSSNPTEPADGEMIIWLSDGTGFGDAGDVMVASTTGSVAKYGTLFDYSGGALYQAAAENVVYAAENVVYAAEQVAYP